MQLVDSSTATPIHIVNPTCSTCESQHAQTPNQWTSMTYKAALREEVIFAADMTRMLIGCLFSAACYCFCPMCLVTRDDIELGRIPARSITATYVKNKRNSRLSFPLHAHQNHKKGCTHYFKKRRRAAFQLPGIMPCYPPSYYGN